MATKFKRTIMLTVFAIISTIALFKAGIFSHHALPLPESQHQSVISDHPPIPPASHTAIPKPISSLTGCHQHGANLFCLTPDGDEIEVLLPGSAPDSKGGHSDSSSESPERHCHFHAGVEHCVEAGEGEGGSADRDCERVHREFNVPLRVIFLLIIFVTSAIGVFGPIFLSLYLPPRFNIILGLLKQFGTGVVISTAFVHLYTHASLMFSNPCIGELSYEGTAAAILMAGLFVSFFIEYAAHRIADKYMPTKGATEGSSMLSRQMINLSVMEAGILFHSLLIGLTLVVTGDAFFITLSIVIVFHQAFEGIALGSCIASLGRPAPHTTHAHGHSHSHHFHATSSTSDAWPDEDARTNTTASDPASSPVPLRKKLFLASGFALVTPLGMAIGICALHRFNGNDPATIWAIGSLDAFSAGILVWVGIVEMWAGDWMLGGCMAHASRLVAGLGLAALVSGMALMSFLGKWA